MVKGEVGAWREEELKEESEKEPSYGKVHEEFPTFWPLTYIFTIRINNIIAEVPYLFYYISGIHIG